MYQKKSPASHLSGILFLLVFFFSLNVFSSKFVPQQKTDDTPDTVSVTALLQTDAVQPQPLVKLKLTPVLPPEPSSFSIVSTRASERCSFSITSSDEGPDLFSRFFYFYHSAYGDEPPVAV